MRRGKITKQEWIRLAVTVSVIIIAIVKLYPFYPLEEVFDFGLDLQGGVRLVYAITGADKMSAEHLQRSIDQVITILTTRVDQFGLADPEIKQMGPDRVLVNLPGVIDRADAERLVGQTAILQFHNLIRAGVRADSDLGIPGFRERILRDREGIPHLVEREPILTGAALASAEARIDTAPGAVGRFHIALEFTREGAEQFIAALARRNPGDRIAITLDDIVLSAPQITASILDAAARGWRAVIDTTTITGDFSRDEARILAISLRAGALPVELTPIEQETIGPTLGRDSIRRGIIAVVTGFILVLLYMPIYYRFLGLAAVFTLILTMLIVFGGLALFGATLTLPGIAGILLTIGMAVDANVIIFERIKEERCAGKSPRVAVKSGFDRSLSALADANITTLLTAGILIIVGTGPVQGFAITLGIGVLGTLFSALVASRFLLETTGLAAMGPAPALVEG
ncbi:protein translocase subunit SecD [Candidatus Acetothermia bacterium]|jgi:protein-export membrane protein SecD|nr:protein translocase subunit SecD [Candidatus Acetothermia bacterium]MCI2427315.1 protein translocase subunit SecD [Candidatus Acetothermia bacterium]MCI2428249.1 protein translocase subunit SecD [Candidatus Acetothermia bacterium]